MIKLKVLKENASSSKNDSTSIWGSVILSLFKTFIVEMYT